MSTFQIFLISIASAFIIAGLTFFIITLFIPSSKKNIKEYSANKKPKTRYSADNQIDESVLVSTENKYPIKKNDKQDPVVEMLGKIQTLTLKFISARQIFSFNTGGISSQMRSAVYTCDKYNDPLVKLQGDKCVKCTKDFISSTCNIVGNADTTCLGTFIANSPLVYAIGTDIGMVFGFDFNIGNLKITSPQVIENINDGNIISGGTLRLKIRSTVTMEPSTISLYAAFGVVDPNKANFGSSPLSTVNISGGSFNIDWDMGFDYSLTKLNITNFKFGISISSSSSLNKYKANLGIASKFTDGINGLLNTLVNEFNKVPVLSSVIKINSSSLNLPSDFLSCQTLENNITNFMSTTVMSTISSATDIVTNFNMMGFIRQLDFTENLIALGKGAFDSLKNILEKFLFDILPDWLHVVLKKYRELKDAVKPLMDDMQKITTYSNTFKDKIDYINNLVATKFTKFNVDQNKRFNKICKSIMALDTDNIDIFNELNSFSDYFDWKTITNLFKIEGFKNPQDRQDYWNAPSNWGFQFNYGLNFGTPVSIGGSLGVGMTCSPITEDGITDWSQGVYQYGDSNSFSISLGAGGGGGQGSATKVGGFDISLPPLGFGFSFGIWWTFGTLGPGVDSVCTGFYASAPVSGESIEIVATVDWTWGVPTIPFNEMNPANAIKFGTIDESNTEPDELIQIGYYYNKCTNDCKDRCINDWNNKCCNFYGGTNVIRADGKTPTNLKVDQLCLANSTNKNLKNCRSLINDNDYKIDKLTVNFIDENPMPAISINIGPPGAGFGIAPMIYAYHSFMLTFPPISSNILVYFNLKQYNIGDKVWYNDKAWRCIQNGTKNITPQIGPNWEPFKSCRPSETPGYDCDLLTTGMNCKCTDGYYGTPGCNTRDGIPYGCLPFFEDGIYNASIKSIGVVSNTLNIDYSFYKAISGIPATSNIEIALYDKDNKTILTGSNSIIKNTNSTTGKIAITPIPSAYTTNSNNTWQIIRIRDKVKNLISSFSNPYMSAKLLYIDTYDSKVYFELKHDFVINNPQITLSKINSTTKAIQNIGKGSNFSRVDDGIILTKIETAGIYSFSVPNLNTNTVYFSNATYFLQLSNSISKITERFTPNFSYATPDGSDVNSGPPQNKSCKDCKCYGDKFGLNCCYDWGTMICRCANKNYVCNTTKDTVCNTPISANATQPFFGTKSAKQNCDY